MGITFRSGDYLRFVRIGGRTIKDGEAAAIWDRNGVHTQIVGPKRVFLVYATVRFLTRFKAESNQYLVVKHRDGKVEHVCGPTSMYLNPTWHDEIHVRDGISLANENEVIAVGTTYKTSDHSDTLASSVSAEEEQRVHKEKEEKSPHWRVVKGPTLFIPSETDVVQLFHWNAPPCSVSPNESNSNGKRHFHEKVQMNTSSIWKTEVPVSTVDFAKFKVTIAITYKIVSAEKCLKVKNPIEELGAALLADCQTLGRALMFEDLKGKTSEIAASFSMPKSYTRLLEVAEICGFHLSSIKLVTLDLPEELQSQLDFERKNAAMTFAEIDKKESKIRLQKLELEEERKKLENQTELARTKAQIDAALDEEIFSQRMAAIERETELSSRQEAARLERLKLSDDSVLHFLKQLKDMGVNLSEFMCTAGGKSLAADILQRAPSLSRASMQGAGWLGDTENTATKHRSAGGGGGRIAHRLL